MIKSAHKTDNNLSLFEYKLKIDFIPKWHTFRGTIAAYKISSKIKGLICNPHIYVYFMIPRWVTFNSKFDTLYALLLSLLIVWTVFTKHNCRYKIWQNLLPNPQMIYYYEFPKILYSNLTPVFVYETTELSYFAFSL